MASTRFYLRSKKTDPAAIMLRLYYESKEFATTTGYSISPKSWNQEKQRAMGKNSEDINSELSSFASKILAIYNEMKAIGDVNNKILKDRLEGKAITPTTRLYAYIQRVIDKKIPQSPRRAQAYRQTFVRLKDFGARYYKRELDFKDIDLDFYDKYLEYLKKDKILADSTIQMEFKILKRFLNLATIEGINSNLLYKSTEFKAPSYQIKHIYITDSEINMMYKMKLTGTLEKVRDIFIIGCRTGLRVSDYWRCVGDTVENGIICIDDTKKTGEPVFIPIHWQVREILAKYNGVPPTLSDSVLNINLRKLGEQAGLNNMVTDTRPHRVGLCEKYLLITTHTARRSCATNMYLAGFDLYFIQGILGHTRVETTVKYLGVSRKAVAFKYQSHEYFHKR
jgi:integrase